MRCPDDRRLAGNANPVTQAAKGFTLNPHIVKAGIILLDPVTPQVARIVVLQYNPTS